MIFTIASMAAKIKEIEYFLDWKSQYYYSLVPTILVHEQIVASLDGFICLSFIAVHR